MRVVFLTPLTVASVASLIVVLRTTFQPAAAGSPAEVVAARFPEEWKQQVPPLPLRPVRARNIDLSASLDLLSPYLTNDDNHAPVLRDVTAEDSPEVGSVARVKARAADIKAGFYCAAGGVPQPDDTQKAVELHQTGG